MDNLAADPARFDYEADEPMPDENAEKLEAIATVLDEVAEAMERAGKKLLSLRVVDQFIPPTNDPRFGYLPGKRVADADVIDGMITDARGNVTAWLQDEYKRHFEE